MKPRKGKKNRGGRKSQWVEEFLTKAEKDDGVLGKNWIGIKARTHESMNRSNISCRKSQGNGGEAKKEESIYLTQKSA